MLYRVPLLKRESCLDSIWARLKQELLQMVLRAVSTETHSWKHARALAAQVQEQPSTLTSDFVKALIILPFQVMYLVRVFKILQLYPDYLFISFLIVCVPLRLLLLFTKGPFSV